MIQDLHAHTYYSFCSEDRIEKVIETAIAGGIQLLGITDHNYGVGCGRPDFCYDKGPALNADYYRTLMRYHDHVNAVKEKYRNKIKVLSGLEVCTLVSKDSYTLPDNVDVCFFDYCLVENLDTPERSIAHGDIFSFAKRLNCPTGIAHTDLFSFIKELGEEPNRYFRKMVEQNIFWELNMNYDSLHGFRVWDYVTEFFKNKTQQEIVRNAGVKLSIGFDGHICKEYKSDRVKLANKLVRDMGIKLVFDNTF